MVYLCRIKYLDVNHPRGGAFRVTNETWSNMTTFPFWRERMECADPYENTKEACFCPSGYGGWRCHKQYQKKCRTSILNPDTLAGCPNKTDSDDYVYSIRGHDPCHEVDFSEQLNIEFNMTCKDVDKDWKVLPGGHKESLGYSFSDVVNVDLSNI